MVNLLVGFRIAGVLSNSQTGQLFTLLTQGGKTNPIVLVERTRQGIGRRALQPDRRPLPTARAGYRVAVLRPVRQGPGVGRLARFLDPHGQRPISGAGPYPEPDDGVRCRQPDAGAVDANCTPHLCPRAFHQRLGTAFRRGDVRARQSRLGNYPPRRMRTVLRQAFGRAAIAKRGEVLPTDIGQPEKEIAKPRIGFVRSRII